MAVLCWGLLLPPSFASSHHDMQPCNLRIFVWKVCITPELRQPLHPATFKQCRATQTAAPRWVPYHLQQPNPPSQLMIAVRLAAGVDGLVLLEHCKGAKVQG